MMNDIVKGAVNLCSGCYICVGIFGYIAFSAVGYRGKPIPGVAFDAHRGVIANDEGRITDDHGHTYRFGRGTQIPTS